jgi:hypothetical protein
MLNRKLNRRIVIAIRIVWLAKRGKMVIVAVDAAESAVLRKSKEGWI